jgi:anti-sigma factor RsiW
MTCEVARTQLSAYIDEILPRDKTAEIRKHIYSCDSCAAIYGTLLAANRCFGADARRQTLKQKSSIFAGGA